jgi:hypothetical protein
VVIKAQAVQNRAEESEEEKTQFTKFNDMYMPFALQWTKKPTDLA